LKQHSFGVQIDCVFEGLAQQSCGVQIDCVFEGLAQHSCGVQIDCVFEKLDPLLSRLNVFRAEDQVAAVGVSQAEHEAGVFAFVKISRFLKLKLSNEYFALEHF
jgi:hypothetical protein